MIKLFSDEQTTFSTNFDFLACSNMISTNVLLLIFVKFFIDFEFP